MPRVSTTAPVLAWEQGDLAWEDWGSASNVPLVGPGKVVCYRSTAFNGGATPHALLPWIGPAVAFDGGFVVRSVDSIAVYRAPERRSFVTKLARVSFAWLPFWHVVSLVRDGFVNVVTKKTLRACWGKHPVSRTPLRSWHKVARAAKWANAAEVAAAFPKVSVLKNNRFVFNIKGNDFRLVVKIHFRTQTVFVRFCGPHDDYDKIDANKV